MTRPGDGVEARSSDSCAPKYSLNSSMRVTPRTVNWRSPSRADVLIVLDVELVVDLADDLLDHVLDGARGPATPPYSSTTIAMWLRLRRNSAAAR